jgi:hypothetical protein
VFVERRGIFQGKRAPIPPATMYTGGVAAGLWTGCTLFREEERWGAYGLVGGRSAGKSQLRGGRARRETTECFEGGEVLQILGACF